MKYKLPLLLLWALIVSSSSFGQGTLLKAKLKLNKKTELTKVKGVKIFTDFREGSLWLYKDVVRGKVENWLINSEPWGSIRMEHDNDMNYYGRAEMGQNFVEIESWIDSVSEQANWVIKSLSDVFFLRKLEREGGEDLVPEYALLKQVVTDKGRTEIPLIEFKYDPVNANALVIVDDTPLSDYPLLMKVTAAWLASLESLGDLEFLSSFQ